MLSMQEMLTLLDAEFSALKEKEQASTLKITQDKEILLTKLMLLEANLLAASKETQFEGDDLAMHLAQNCHEYSAQNIRELSKKVQHANQRNGALLQALIRINEQGMNLLLGKRANPSVYGASGQIETAPSQLTKLATA